MILIIGAMGAGKNEYIRSLGFGENCLGESIDGNEPVLYGLHEIIRKNGFFDEGWLNALGSKDIICCDEVGCGVVPLDAGERKWRDEVGKACCVLAREANTVVRVACGIAQAIKGTLPCE